MMHLRCSSPLFLVAFLLFLVGSPSFAHTPPAPQTNTGSAPPPPCLPPCKCTCPTPPLSPNNGGSTPPNNGGSTPPGPPNNEGSTPPPNNGGSTPPPPNNGGSTPPPSNGGSTPPPNSGGSTPPPNHGGSTPPPSNGGSTPPPNSGGSTPPPNHGGSTPPPNNGGSTPPPNNGGSTPPPNNGGSTPPPNHGGSTPPPDNGGSTPPPNNGGSTPPPPNNGGSTPPPNNGGSTPPPNNGGSTPPPNNGGSTPPSPNNGDSTPPPNNGGSTPPPNNGGSTPPQSPNNGGSTPPPTNGGSTPPLPPNNGGSTPPPNNGGSTPPQPPNNGGSTPPPTNGGSTPPLPPNNGGSTPPKSGGSTPPLPPNNGGSTPPNNGGLELPPNNGGSELPPNNGGSAPPLPPNNAHSIPPAQQKGHIENFVHSVYNGSFSMVFAFGDSYTDTGNALSLGSLSDAFSSSKSPLQGSGSASGSVSVSGSITTHGNPSNDRCSNGRLVIDFVSEAIGLPSPPPYKSKTSSEFSYGANFAIAGATSLSAGSFTKIAHNFITKGTPLGTQSQTEWFNEYRANACKGKSKSECDSKIQNALFWIGEIGFNDYIRAANSPFSLKSIQELCTRDVIGLVKVILEGGGKYIVVQGLPPMGCLPFDVALTKHQALSKVGCSIAINSAITVHNQVLHLQLNQLRKQYPDREILYANFWDAFMTILKNARKFNFAESFKVCCGAGGNNLNFVPDCLCGSPGASACKDPSQYINWDGIHLTEAMYKQVTDLFLNQGFCQPSFEQMVKKKNGA